jgi:hypothetical protein
MQEAGEWLIKTRRAREAGSGDGKDPGKKQIQATKALLLARDTANLDPDMY